MNEREEDNISLTSDADSDTISTKRRRRGGKRGHLVSIPVELQRVFGVPYVAHGEEHSHAAILLSVLPRTAYLDPAVIAPCIDRPRGTVRRATDRVRVVVQRRGLAVNGVPTSDVAVAEL